MKNRNICKFSLPTISNELSISCFVLETNMEVMKNLTTLTSNRVILIEQGTGVFLINDVPYSFEVGTLIFAFEGETISLKEGNGVRYLYIDFTGSRGKTLLQRFGIYPSSRKYKNFNGLIPFFKESLLNTLSSNIDITAESVLLYLFSKLYSDTPKQNDVLQEIIDFTKENFKNPELTISAVAEEIDYNAKYLSHFFKTRMNVNYSEYLRSIRLKYAISLFENGISSIKNVSFLSGFSDPLYFSNVFKKEIGYSPKEFIAQLSKNDNH